MSFLYSYCDSRKHNVCKSFIKKKFSYFSNLLVSLPYKISKKGKKNTYVNGIFCNVSNCVISWHKYGNIRELHFLCLFIQIKGNKHSFIDLNLY